MCEPHHHSTNVDESMLSFDELPEKPSCLADGHPLQGAVQTLAAQCLQAYNTARTTAAASQPSIRAMRQLSLRPKPCRHTRLRSSSNTTTTKTDAAASLDAMACPFYKRNPMRYHSCAWAVNIRNTRSAKQHVIIDHHAPIYCPICSSHFPSAVARDKHVRARSCTERELTADTLEGVTEDQVEKLLQRDVGKAARRMREAEEASWFRMWDVLFTGVVRPKTAYLSSPREREVLALRRFWRRRAKLGAVREFLGEGVDEATLKAMEASVFQNMVVQAGLL
ncbi:hypothetical protein VTI74DRAFT_3602 [Chaetomium olivicolor]